MSKELGESADLSIFTFLCLYFAADLFFGPCFAEYAAVGLICRSRNPEARPTERLAYGGSQGPGFLIICFFFDGIEKGSEID